MRESRAEMPDGSGSWDELAISKAMNMPVYEHSLVIFRNGRPVVRHDFEKPRIVSVERS